VRSGVGGRVGRPAWTVVGLVLVGGLGLLVPAVASAPAAVAAAVGLHGGGSVDEAWLTGAGPGDRIDLVHDGHPVAVTGNPGTADTLGSLIVRNLTPGSGYAWHDSTTRATTAEFSVLAPGADPATGSTLYTGQTLHQGLNYLTMRDGIRLAATVRYPYGSTCSAVAPCPTVIEYSGYGTAGPTDPIPSILAKALHTPCTGCGDANLLPDGSTDVGAVVARFAGFATVSVQMRGTGCSGGAFDLFGYPSDYDAYDAIEIVAHQDWVAHHKVGMVGISYSGLSQLPAAGTDPPGLAAIAPMSPTDDLFSTGYPGGIFNDGFAGSWVDQRIDDAKPAAVLTGRDQLAPLATIPVSGVGQPWAYYEIDAERAASGGASTCLSDQALHGQSESLATLVGPQLVAPGTGPGRAPSLLDRRSMSQWATHIRVPVFVSGAMQDEQTGPQWPALLSALPTTTPVFANLVNGGHIDSTDPQITSRWLEFLDLYVADRVPTEPKGIGGLVLSSFTSTSAGTPAAAPLPAIRFTSAPDLSAARSEFVHQTPRVRTLFDSGAGPVGPGDPQSTYAATFAQWPPAGTTTTYWLGSGGGLTTTRPASGPQGSATLRLDPSVRPATSLPSTGNAWAAAPDWDWTTVPAADGLGFQTAPFTTDTTIVGPAALDLWVRSGSPVVDLQATVTEVRPGAGDEEYVTSGFLRSSNQVDRSPTRPLSVVPTYLRADARTLSATRYELVRIPIDPIVHTFRAGTELRVVLSAPGGDRPTWEFATLDDGQTASVGFGGVAASRLVVDVVPGIRATAALPTCGILRGEPCRPYLAEGNQT